MDEFEEWFHGKKNKDDKEKNSWEEYKKEVDKLDVKPKVKTLKNVNIKKIKIKEFAPSLPDKSFNLEAFDYKVRKKIYLEKVAIEAILDLHGYTIKQAENIVINFILDCYKQDKIYIMIITGKGALANERVTLRQELPNFLANSQIAPIIVSYTKAGRKHGDEGAFYIILRKNKS